MVHTGIGTDRKLRRLAPAERWVYLAGVLPIAAESPVRGTLHITDGLPATVDDYAEQAGVTRKVAASALKKLRDLGLVKPSEGGELVHNWDEWQPAPKKDTTATERKRRQREREKAGAVTEKSHRDSHGDGHAVTPGREEKRREAEVAVLPNAVGSKNGADPQTPSAKTDPVRQVFDHWVTVTGRTGRTLLDPKRERRIKQALSEAFKATGSREAALQEVLDAISGAWKADYIREKHPEWTGIETILRDREQVEKFRDIHRNGTGPKTVDHTHERLRRAEQ